MIPVWLFYTIYWPLCLVCGYLAGRYAGFLEIVAVMLASATIPAAVEYMGWLY